MSSYFIGALIAGALLVGVYLIMALKVKDDLRLDRAIGLMVSALGAMSGIRIWVYILSGKITVTYGQTAKPPSEEDFFWFLIGGLALVWISMDPVVRLFRDLGKRIRASPRKKRSDPPINDPLD